MPIYESEKPGCDTCRQRFEVIQAVSDPPLTKCPDCSAPVHRFFSAFAPTRSPDNLTPISYLAQAEMGTRSRSYFG